MTQEKFKELAKKYGIDVLVQEKLQEKCVLWLMPGDKNHWIAKYQKFGRKNYITIAINYVRFSKYSIAATDFLNVQSKNFEHEIQKAIKNFKKFLLTDKIEAMKEDFKK